MNVIIFSLSFSYVIFLWLETNTLIEYYALFKMKGLSWVDSYICKNSVGFIENFVPHLVRNYSEYFLVRLVTCSVCLSTWGGIFSIYFVGWKFLVVGFLSLVGYYILKILKNYAKNDS